MAEVPSSAKCVVIGAGIVGNSLVWHLADLGWRDIVQIDKGALPNPGGSTGHASNFIFPVDHSREMTDLTQDSVRQYQEMDVFTQSGGFEIARTPARMEELRRRMSSAKAWGIEAELVDPAFVQEKVPFIETDQFIGGFWCPTVGVVDSLRAGTIMRERAMELGALTVVPNAEVTGLDVEENQARRLLNDLDSYRAATDRQNEDEDLVAHDWLTQIYEPITRAVPRDLRAKLEPAELFHEVLEHRWYMSEKAGKDVPIETAIADYVKNVLPEKPDEKAIVGADTEAIPVRARPD